jgi:hypothetical protein
LPADLVTSIEQAMAQPNPAQDEAKQIAKATAIAKLNQMQSAAELNNSKSGATQATAIYDVAMAEHLLAKADDKAGLKELTDAAHKAAQIGTEQAKAAKLRAEVPQAHAKTAAELVGLGKTHAETVATHADAAATRQGLLAPTNGNGARAPAPAPARPTARDEVLHAHLEALSRHAASQTAAMNALVRHATAPKRRIPHRDVSGRITHVDEVTAQ